MSDPALDAVIRLGVEPVSQDQPGGTSVRNEDEYAELQAEISKLESLTGGAVDWPRVVELGTGILSSKSKDILVASYLSLGLFERFGYEGLAAASRFLADLLQNFWETLYPEVTRLRGRIGAVEWFSERLGLAVDQRDPDPGEDDAVRAAREAAVKLAEAVDSRFGDESPGLGDLLQALRQRVDDLAVRAEPKAPQPVAPAAAPGIPTAITSIREAHNAVRQVVTYLREQDQADPVPYVLLREVEWAAVAALPPNNGGKTMIPGPSPGEAKEYQELGANRDWSVLLERVENRLTKAPLWLDLQRFADRAMEGLGLSPVREAVRGPFARFLRRLPGIQDLSFQSGVAFADPETRLWIDGTILASGGEGGSAPGPQAAAGADDERLIEADKKAREQAQGGRFQEAITILQEGLRDTAGRRERFLWRSAIARLCLDAGQAALALAQLEALDEDIRHFSLEEWEPALALEVLKSLYQCQGKVVAGTKQPLPGMAERMEELYRRLCRLDVVVAAALKGR